MHVRVARSGSRLVLCLLLLAAVTAAAALLLWTLLPETRPVKYDD